MSIATEQEFPTEIAQSSDTDRTRCPRWLRLFIAILVGLNLYTVLGTIANRRQLQTFDLPFSLTTRVVFNGFWAIFLLWLLIAAWRRDRRALFWIGPSVTVYALSGLVWMFLFTRADYDRGRFGFEIAVTVIVLLPIWWVALRRGWFSRERRHGDKMLIEPLQDKDLV